MLSRKQQYYRSLKNYEKNKLIKEENLKNIPAKKNKLIKFNNTVFIRLIPTKEENKKYHTI